ncbi:MAG: hypothetical protein MUE73_10810 [Planctomycetes bacterium]|nr:hypothetical protein [Planctomycetota bacterium]
MARFLAGVVLGAAVVAIAWVVSAVPWEGSPAPGPPVNVTEAPEREAMEGVAYGDGSATGPIVEWGRPAVPAASPLFPPGEATLRIGEGYVFGEDRAIARGAGRPADLICLEIAGGGIVVECPHGGRLAAMPLGALGLPADLRRLLALLHDGPADLAPGILRLGTSVRRDVSPVGMARAGSGAVHRLAVVEVSHEPDALARTARLVFEQIPVREGGGTLGVPTAVKAADRLTSRDIEAWMEEDSRIPGATFTGFLRGEYRLLEAPPAELVLEDRSYLVLAAPLETKIEFNEYSGLVAPRGIAAGGEVRVRSYTGVAVRGDMAGTIDVNSYAHLHVTGDLSGRVNVQSYATVVIEGDLTGEVLIRSYTTLLLRGRLLGKLSIVSGGSHFWFEQWMSRADAEALDGRDNELNLRTSDVSDGKYGDWKGWGTVTVGAEVWRLLAKR